MATAALQTLTDEQCRAIETRDISVALSAGAGCGKTFVLTERFLSYFDPSDPTALRPNEVGRLMAITFTDRAAREMRDRIRRKCSERLQAAGPDDAPYWADVLRNLDSARISTIHSFCSALLRTHAVEARLDPQFQVLERAQSDTLLAESIDRVLHKRLAETSEPVLELLVAFGLERTREMLARLVSKRHEREFSAWLRRTPEECLERWQQYFQHEVPQAAVRALLAAPAVNQILAILDRHESSHPKMQKRIAEVRRILTAWQNDRCQPKNIAADVDLLIENARVQSGGGMHDWDSEEAYAAFRDAAKELREEHLAKIRKCLEFDLDHAREAAAAGLDLISVAAVVADDYDRRKRELQALDFNDLIARAGQLLTDPAHEHVRRGLAAQLKLLLVDEFQDTDPLQVELVSALCGERMTDGKLFFVGDYKQSIYRFRGADPDVFLALQDQMPAEGRLPLTLNFRSQPAILNFVNTLFADELGRDYEPLRPARDQLASQPSIEFMWAPAGDCEGEKPLKEDLRKREAEWIARRLRGLLDSDEPIVSSRTSEGDFVPRRLQPGDIALLFRALSDVEFYEEALRRYGIEYYLVGGHAFYAQQEIFDLANLLRFLNSGGDQISLAGALRSPFFSLADETLFWLAQHPQGLAAGLFAGSHFEELSPEQRKQATFAAETLRSLKAMKDRVPIAQLISEVLRRTGYDAALLVEFMGERKLANLRKLIDQARGFDRAGFFTLSDFIVQLSTFVANQPDEALAATHPEDTNVVRLMTIHQAKGLEFPLVVVPDLDRPLISRYGGVAYTDRLGPLVKMPAGSNGAESTTGYDLHALIEVQHELEESKRLFYVATTRAADHLILSSGVEELGQAKGPWLRMLATKFDVVTGQLLAKHRHDDSEPQIKVITTRPPVSQPVNQPGRRKDLKKLADRAERMAGTAKAQLCASAQPIPPDAAACREFVLSRIDGGLHDGARARSVDWFGSSRESRLAVDPPGLETLLHSVLAGLRFDESEDLRALVTAHAARHLPRDRKRAAEALATLEAFVSSDRYAQLARADESYADLEFTLARQQGAHKLLLSGWLDRLYRDSSRAWHLVCFKPDRAQVGSGTSSTDACALQMLLCGTAAEAMLDEKLATLTLHFLGSSEEITFALDNAAPARLASLIARATATDRPAAASAAGAGAEQA